MEVTPGHDLPREEHSVSYDAAGLQPHMTHCEDQYRETHAMERDARVYFQFRINASQISNCHIGYSYNTRPSAALICRPIERVTSTP